MHSDLQLRNLSELPISTRRFATAAANGSWKDIRLLMERAGSNLQPRHIPRHILPIFFANLDPAGIPSVDELDPDSPAFRPPCIPLIMIAMQAMTTVRRQLFEAVPLGESCAEFWPRVWQWIEFFHTYEEVLPDLQDFPAEDRYALYMSTILDLESHPDTAVKIRATPGVYSVLVRTWGLLVQPSSSSRITDPGLHELCGFVDRMPDPTPFTSRRAAINPRDFVVILRRHIEGVRAAYDPLSDSTVSLLRCALKILPTLLALQPGDALLSLGVAHTVTGVLFEEGASLSGTLTLLQDSFRVLKILRNAPGSQWILEAIDADLLGALRTCGEPKFHAVHASVTQLLEHIAPYLVYHPFVSAVERKLKDVLHPTAALKGSPIIKVWNEFIDLAAQRVLVLVKFEKEGHDFLKVRECENPQCARPGLRNERDFKRCSGCMTCVYCSTECQTFDWRHGEHRTICKQIYSDRLVRPETHSKLNRAFFLALLNSDYQSLEPEVLVFQIQFMHACPDVPSVTVFDYSVMPLKIRVIPRETIEVALSQGVRAQMARTARDPDAGAQRSSLLMMIPAHATVEFRHFVLHTAPATLEGMHRALGEVGAISSEEEARTFDLFERAEELSGQYPDEVMITL